MYESVQELLESASLDGVLIAAPTDQHPELVAIFAAARIPMLCEKPVGISPEDAERATRAAADAGVLLQVGYWRRFVPELRQLREQIAAGELGQISLISCMQWDSELPSEQFRSHAGGIMVDMGVHEFDQVRWLLGDEFESIVAVPAGPSTQPRPATDPDSAVLLGDDLPRCCGDNLTRAAIPAPRLVLGRGLGYEGLRPHPVHVGRRG